MTLVYKKILSIGNLYNDFINISLKKASTDVLFSMSSGLRGQRSDERICNLVMRGIDLEFINHPLSIYRLLDKD
jgi:hypothetical protein